MHELWRADHGSHLWTLTEEQSRPFIRKAIELGTNVFDTANVYSDGTSEEILGRAIRDYSARDDVVIAIKVDGRMKPVPSGIIGANKLQHLDDAVAALSIRLADAEIQPLEINYIPHSTVGFS